MLKPRSHMSQMLTHYWAEPVLWSWLSESWEGELSAYLETEQKDQYWWEIVISPMFCPFKLKNILSKIFHEDNVSEIMLYIEISKMKFLTRKLHPNWAKLTYLHNNNFKNVILYSTAYWLPADFMKSKGTIVRLRIGYVK